MGVVYEAVQISLGRRVALKVLPFAAALDTRQLRRFKNEAQAAAHLHHQNIVPVFGVGSDRGVHYFAMQYIEGQTLAATIDELRKQAAMERAGQKDGLSIGPATVMLIGKEPVSPEWPAEPTATWTPEAEAQRPPQAHIRTRSRAGISTERANQWPAYFRTVAQLSLQAAEGLEHAHQLGVIHRDIKPANLIVDVRGNLWITDFGLAHIRGDSKLTMTGDLLGTLRYMSPEQALGKRRLVDHRADIYSLGATLYELATLEPVFPGSERQELLHKIALEDPTPPRRVNPALPADLETILLKALAKDPDARYASAQELADDLRRFLKDEPILARRPTLFQKAAKWRRRHRAVVNATFMTAIIGLVAGLVLLWSEKTRTDKERQRAEDKLELARQAVDDMYLQAENWLRYEPQTVALQSTQKEFLEKALGFYKELAEARSSDPSVRAKTANAYYRIGEISQRLGNQWFSYDGQLPDFKHEADVAYHRAVVLLSDLVADYPEELTYQFDLARCQMAMGILLVQIQGRQPEAEEVLAAPCAALEKLANEHPEESKYSRQLAGCYATLGDLQPFTAFAKADQYYRQALELYGDLHQLYPAEVDYANWLAATWVKRGNHFQMLRRFQDAEGAFTRALALLDNLEKDSLVLPDYQHSRGQIHYWLVSLYQQTGRPKEAEQACQKALELFQQLVGHFPRVPRYHGYLGDTLDKMAVMVRDQGAPEKALALAKEAILHQRVALKGSPGQYQYHFFLRNNLVDLADIFLRLGKLDRAAERAVEVTQVLPGCFMGETYAMVLFGQCSKLEKDANKARRFAEQAQQYLHQVLQKVQPDATTLNWVAWYLATNPVGQFPDPQPAINLAKKAVAKMPKNPEIRNTLGVAYYRAQKWDEAIAALEKAVELNAEGGQAHDWFFLAMAHWQLGHKAEANDYFDKGVDEMKKDPGNEECIRFRAEAATLLGRDAQARRGKAGKELTLEKRTGSDRPDQSQSLVPS
jgi:serine/threonine protein kinase/Flp pilus assembly protein TadD